MPAYAVHLNRPLEQVGHLAIEDDRSLVELASVLHGSGFIETTDVTALAGRPQRSKRMVLFLGDVSRIYSSE